MVSYLHKCTFCASVGMRVFRFKIFLKYSHMMFIIKQKANRTYLPHYISLVKSTAKLMSINLPFIPAHFNVIYKMQKFSFKNWNSPTPPLLPLISGINCRSSMRIFHVKCFTNIFVVISPCRKCKSFGELQNTIQVTEVLENRWPNYKQSSQKTEAHTVHEVSNTCLDFTGMIWKNIVFSTYSTVWKWGFAPTRVISSLNAKLFLLNNLKSS